MKPLFHLLSLAALGLILFSFFPRPGHNALAATVPSLTEYWTLSDAVYKLSTTLENGGTYVPPKGYKLLKVSTAAQLADGFAAAAFQDANGNVIIANEGTLGGSDVYGGGSLVADLVIAAGNIPPALTDAQTFAKQVEKQLGGKTPIFVTGHSLGGIEAEAETYFLYTGSTPTNAAGGATFGATGLPKQTTPGGPPNLIDYVDYGDPVGNDASDTGTQSPDPLAPATPMYHYGTVIMTGTTYHALGLEGASYLETQSKDIDQRARYGAYSGKISDAGWIGAISLLALGLLDHKVSNYASDLSINPGSTPVVPLDSLDTAIYGLGEPLANGDESNLGSGKVNSNGTLTTPDFNGSFNSSTDQFSVKQTANITDVFGTIVSGGTTTLTLDPKTNSITQETYTSPDGTTYNATLDPTTQEYQTVETNEANGGSYQISYTYNSNNLASTATNDYSGTNLTGTVNFTETTNYDANGVATSADISGTGDIATLDNADVTIESNASPTSKGNTINGTDNTIFLGTNDNVTLAAASGETSFRDTVNATSSTVDFTTDTITFEGHSITGNIPANGIDQYGRTYAVNGKTVTISNGSDSLTITGFVNGDFGVNFGYTYMTVNVSGTNVTEIYGINNSGQLAGAFDGAVTEESFTGTSDNLVLLTNAYIRDCPPPDGVDYLFAQAINNVGAIVGEYWSCATGGTVGAIYSNGAMTSVSAQPLDPNVAIETTLDGINDFGEIVGYYGPQTGYPNGFLDFSGSLSTLNYPHSLGTTLVGINNTGTIVGDYFTSKDQPPPISGPGHGFVYANGTFTAINVPGSDANSTAIFGINDLGQILGSYKRGGNTYYYLDTGGKFLTLNFSIPQAVSNSITISGLNNQGQIVGFYSSGSMTSGFVATPIAATSPNAVS